MWSSRRRYRASYIKAGPSPAALRMTGALSFEERGKKREKDAQ